MGLMVDLNRRNQQSFVIVTHDPRIAAMTSRIIRMKDGVIVSDEQVNGEVDRQPDA
jgi:putative ABC transport system ATP-binding protein